MIGRWLRARRDRRLRGLNDSIKAALRELRYPETQRLIAEEFKRRDDAAKARAWFDAQKAKRDAERQAELADPRRRLLLRLNAIRFEEPEKRHRLTSWALAEYIDDPEITEQLREAMA